MISTATIIKRLRKFVDWEIKAGRFSNPRETHIASIAADRLQELPLSRTEPDTHVPEPPKKPPEYSNMIALDVLWFTELGRSPCIGIMKCKDTITEEIKYYIGTGNGHDEDTDTRIIMGHGAKFYPDAVERLISRGE